MLFAAKLNPAPPPGLVTDSEKESAVRVSIKRSNATPVKPHEGNHPPPPIPCWRIPAGLSRPSLWFCWFAEISSRTDVKVEGDKRLDKLESFLDKLHNKGTVSPSVSVSVSPQRNSRTSVTFNGVNIISDWDCLLLALWFGWLTLWASGAVVLFFSRRL